MNILTMNHVLIVKQPRKKQRVVIIKKNKLQFAHDLISTMAVMRPKWKCELIEVSNEDDAGIPVEVTKQAIIQPLCEKEENFRQHLMSMVR